MKYDVFISYAQDGQKVLAFDIQQALQRLAKPWYKRRALRLFRDQSDLRATSHLSDDIFRAIDDSRFFLYLGSSQSASSRWVNDEIRAWVGKRDPQTTLLAVLDGVVAWDREQNDFDWIASSAIGLRNLQGFLRRSRFGSSSEVRMKRGVLRPEIRFS